MNPTKNILLTAAIAGLVAGASINAQADHHEGDGKAGAEKHEKGKMKHAAKMAGKKADKKGDGCSGPNGCNHHEEAKSGDAAAPAAATSEHK